MGGAINKNTNNKKANIGENQIMDCKEFVIRVKIK